MAAPLPQDQTTDPLHPSPERAELRLVPGAAALRRATLAPPPGVWAAVVGSRALLFLVGYLTVARVPQAASTARTLTYNRAQLLPGALGQMFNAWANWDGQWYVKIARVGYPTRDYAAFFPLYPTLVRWLGPLTAHRYIIAGVALSLTFYVAAMYVLYRLIAIDYGSRVATWTVAFASLFPTSFFFQAVYTESAFFFLVVTCLFFARREQWLFAGLAGFFCRPHP